jgi:hypothetical protein
MKYILLGRCAKTFKYYGLMDTKEEVSKKININHNLKYKLRNGDIFLIETSSVLKLLPGWDTSAALKKRRYDQAV